MGKSKKGRTGLSDRVRERRQKGAASSIDSNPFEFKVNHQKHNVLGRKLTKFDKGRPGISRSKAINKRKETLLVEYRAQGKGNQFIDRRLGEYDKTMTADEKSVKRFALERKRYDAQRSRGGEGEDDDEEEEEEGGVLTHRGQSLAEIETFADRRPSSDLDDDTDEDDNDHGKISAKIVGEQHFGGFLKRKTGDEEEGGEGVMKKSHRELMEEIIAKSKKAKFERRSEKERTAEMTDKLDAEWREFEQLREAIKVNRESSVAQLHAAAAVASVAVSAANVKTADKYDMTVRELQFEIKGKPTDRLKSKEETERQEKERLAKLEADRLRRQLGSVGGNKNKKTVTMSADDLDDGFYLEEDINNKDEHSEEEEEKSSDEEEDDKDDDKVDKDSDNEIDRDMEEDDDSEEEEDNKNTSGPKKTTDKMEEEEEEAVDEDQEESDDDDNPMKHLSDLEESSDEENNEAQEQERNKEGHGAGTESESGKSKVGKKTNEKMKEDEDDTSDKLNATTESFAAVMNRFLLLSGGLWKSTTGPMLNRLTVQLYELTQRNGDEAAEVTAQLIHSRQEEFTRECGRRGGKGIYPQLDTLLLLKSVHVLFPTSDRRHCVVSPSILFISQIISQCPVVSAKDVASGLFLTSLLLQYMSLSQRFIPEVINFLRGILFLAVDKSKESIEIGVVPPFKSTDKHDDLLRLKATDCSNLSIELPQRISRIFMSSKQFASNHSGIPTDTYVNTDLFRVNSLCQCIQLAAEAERIYSNLPSYVEIFSPIARLLRFIPLHRYPQSIRLECEALMSKLSEPRIYSRLVRANKKPQPLKQFTPKFEEVFDGRRKRSASGAAGREFSDKQRLMNKYKKELKGAKREIRRDQQFLSNTKLQEQIERDTERKQKTKTILNQLANQEGEVKALRKNKKIKKN